MSVMKNHAVMGRVDKLEEEVEKFSDAVEALRDTDKTLKEYVDKLTTEISGRIDTVNTDLEKLD